MTAGLLLANAGTPLIWGSACFLAVGNYFIGWGEGWLLARVFVAPLRGARHWMIAANYFSALVGLILLPFVYSWLMSHVLTGLPLYNLQRAFWIMAAIAFAATVVLEWPFCWLALRSRNASPKPSAGAAAGINALTAAPAAPFAAPATRAGPLRALGASLLVQAASYACIFPLYLALADTRLTRDVTPDPTLSFIPADHPARVYFIASDDGDVYSVNLRGGDRRHAFTLTSSNPSTRLYAVSNAALNGWDLWLGPQHNRGAEDHWRIGPIRGAPAVVAHAEHSAAQLSGINWETNVATFGEPEEHVWNVRYFYWEGSLYAQRGSDSVTLRWETTYSRASVSNVVVLPDDLIVFQLTVYAPRVDQIAVADPSARRIGVIALGRGPLVVYPDRDRMPPPLEARTQSRSGAPEGTDPHLDQNTEGHDGGRIAAGSCIRGRSSYRALPTSGS